MVPFLRRWSFSCLKKAWSFNSFNLLFPKIYKGGTLSVQDFHFKTSIFFALLSTCELRLLFPVNMDFCCDLPFVDSNWISHIQISLFDGPIYPGWKIQKLPWERFMFCFLKSIVFKYAQMRNIVCPRLPLHIFCPLRNFLYFKIKKSFSKQECRGFSC